VCCPSMIPVIQLTGNLRAGRSRICDEAQAFPRAIVDHHRVRNESGSFLSYSSGAVSSRESYRNINGNNSTVADVTQT